MLKNQTLFLALKAHKQVWVAISGKCGRLICYVMNAAGVYVFPMMIYPGLHIQAECHDIGPDGTVYVCFDIGSE